MDRFEARPARPLCLLLCLGAVLTSCSEVESGAQHDRIESNADDAGGRAKSTDVFFEYTCGDDVVEPGETCEPGTHIPTSCEPSVYSTGTVQCSDECQLNYQECMGGACMNGILEAGEQCDGRVGSGSIECAGDAECGGCTAACTVVARSECGNGVAEFWREECDGDDFLPVVWREFGEVDLTLYDSETLTCTQECQVELGNAAPAVCGNQVTEAGEDCDPNFGVLHRRTADGRRESCVDCVWQPDPSSCGDGVLQPGFEVCEGDTFVDGRSTCQEWVNMRPDSPYYDRQASCANDCRVDLIACGEFSDRDASSDASGDVSGPQAEDAQDDGNTGSSADSGANRDAPQEPDTGCAVLAGRPSSSSILFCAIGLVIGARRRSRRA